MARGRREPEGQAAEEPGPGYGGRLTGGRRAEQIPGRAAGLGLPSATVPPKKLSTFSLKSALMRQPPFPVCSPSGADGRPCLDSLQLLVY